MDLRPKGIPWDQETYKRIERKGGVHYKSTVSDYIDLERKIEAHELRYADRVEVYGDQVYNGMRITDCVVVLNGGVYMSTGIKDPEAPTEQERYDSVTVTGSGRQVDDEDATDINPNRPTPPANELVNRDGRVCVVECVAWDPARKGDYWREPSPNIADLERRIALDMIGDGDLVFIEDTAECANVLPELQYMITAPVAHSNYPPSAVPEHVSYSGDRKVYPALSEADEAMRVSLGMTRPQWDEWNHGGGWSDPAPMNPAELRKTAIYFAGRAEYHRKAANVWLGVTVACLLLMVGVLFIPTGWVYMLFEAFQ